MKRAEHTEALTADVAASDVLLTQAAQGHPLQIAPLDRLLVAARTWTPAADTISADHEALTRWEANLRPPRRSRARRMTVSCLLGLLLTGTGTAAASAAELPAGHPLHRISEAADAVVATVRSAPSLLDRPASVPDTRPVAPGKAPSPHTAEPDVQRNPATPGKPAPQSGRPSAPGRPDQAPGNSGSRAKPSAPGKEAGQRPAGTAGRGNAEGPARPALGRPSAKGQQRAQAPRDARTSHARKPSKARGHRHP